MERQEAHPRVKSFKKSRKYAKYVKKHGAKSTRVYPFAWNYTEEAIGPFCKDLDGNILLDFTNHVASSPLGYNHPKIKNALKKLNLKDPLKIAGQDFYVSGDFPGPGELQEKILETTEKFNLDKVFLVNSGAEAVENAIKISYDHAGTKGICFNGSFHGRTLGALSLTTSKNKYRKGFPHIPGIHPTSFCTCGDKHDEECECGAIEELKKTINDVKDISYVIIEPIQGEGGYRIPSKEFMKTLGDLTKNNEIKLISDEIQAGIGRTGKFWGIEHYKPEPDIITGAKGLRVGATISKEEIFPSEKARISTTWGGGDILSSFVSYKTLQAIKEENLVENAAKKGKYLIKRLNELKQKSREIKEVRGKGLMVAMEFKEKEKRNKTVKKSFENGLILLGCGEKSIRFLPPLDVREREIDMAMDILEKPLG